MFVSVRFFVSVAIVLSVFIPRAFPNPLTEMKDFELEQSGTDTLTFATYLPPGPSDDSFKRYHIAMTSWLLTDPRAARRRRAMADDAQTGDGPADPVRDKPRPFRGRDQTGRHQSRAGERIAFI
jgi:hypothetical protein